jgi:predicted nucleotidyltransferase
MKVAQNQGVMMTSDDLKRYTYQRHQRLRT